jgi:hypothetical protein
LCRGDDTLLGGKDFVDQEHKIFWVKFVHSLFFFLMTVCILYVLFSGLFNRVGVLTWIAIVLVISEGLVLAINRGRCPLTTLAEDMGAEDGSVTGIFLPRWLAKRVFHIWPVVFLGACVLVVIRRISNG